MNLTLNSLEHCDALPAIKPLIGKAIDDADFWNCDSGRAAELLAKRTYGSDESLLIVAQDDQGGIQGFAVCVPFSDPLSGECLPLLLFLWVAAPLRRHGIARALVGETRKQLKANGFEKLQARIPHGDDALLAMGERWGLVRQWEILADD